MNIRTSIILGMSIPVVFSILLGAYLYSQTKLLNKSYEHMHSYESPLKQILTSLELGAVRLVASTSEFGFIVAEKQAQRQHSEMEQAQSDGETSGVLDTSSQEEDEIELIRFYGARTLAVTMNEEGLNVTEIKAYQKDLSKKLNIPVVRPLKENLDGLIPVIRDFIAESK